MIGFVTSYTIFYLEEQHRISISVSSIKSCQTTLLRNCTSGQLQEIWIIRKLFPFLFKRITIIPFLKKCNLYIIAFAIDSQCSLENALTKWYPMCLTNSGADSFIMFIGTKLDQERSVTEGSSIKILINDKWKETMKLQMTQP